MTKVARYTATVFLFGALGAGWLGGAGAAVGGDELQRSRAGTVVKAAVHDTERCPLDRHELYLEALRRSAAARDN
jgi:hypothetical protein